jgi:hypothetical protein
MRNCKLGVKIIKEKTREYTFIQDGMHLEHSGNTRSADNKNVKPEREYTLREDAKVNHLKHKSKMTGGHNKQGHSPVYE